MDNPVKFESKELIAEWQINESIIGKKRKYHKGKNFKRFWVFGISSPSEHKIYIEFVESRDKPTQRLQIE